MSGFNDIGLLERMALALLSNWGFGSYVAKDQFRADILIVRDQVGLILGAARKSVEMAEGNYRREFLPPPSRDKPRHDPAAVAKAQKLERLAKTIGGLQGALKGHPVPSTDRTTERFRQDTATLQALTTTDQQLTGQAELLRTTLEKKDGAWLIENESEVQEGISAISETLRQRQQLLAPA